MTKFGNIFAKWSDLQRIVCGVPVLQGFQQAPLGLHFRLSYVQVGNSIVSPVV